MCNKDRKNQPNENRIAIHNAMALEYASEKLAVHYNKWAKNYDHDVQNEEYSGPQFIAHYLNDCLYSVFGQSLRKEDISILDAGCGTGLVGVALHDKGYRHLDGFDLSETMVEKARQTNIYQTLTAGCDMLKKIPTYKDNQYDVTVCCGVFTTGHVPPMALQELIRITKSGGIIVASTRKSYYKTTPFKQVYQQLEQTGVINLLDCAMDAPYLAEEEAHYWAFSVS